MLKFETCCHLLENIQVLVKLFFLIRLFYLILSVMIQKFILNGFMKNISYNILYSFSHSCLIDCVELSVDLLVFKDGRNFTHSVFLVLMSHSMHNPLLNYTISDSFLYSLMMPFFSSSFYFSVNRVCFLLSAVDFCAMLNRWVIFHDR
jgi:hypothetical protein